MLDVRMSSWVDQSMYLEPRRYYGEWAVGAMAPPRSTLLRTKSPAARGRPKKALSESQPPGPQQQLESASPSVQPSNLRPEGVAAASANEPAQHAGSTQKPVAGCIHAACSESTPSSYACAQSGSLAASSSMTRRGFRVRLGFSTSDPDRMAEELRSVSIDLSRTQAELAKVRVETEHFKEQHRKANNNYTLWHKRALAGTHVQEGAAAAQVSSANSSRSNTTEQQQQQQQQAAESTTAATGGDAFAPHASSGQRGHARQEGNFSGGGGGGGDSSSSSSSSDSGGDNSSDDSSSSDDGDGGGDGGRGANDGEETTASHKVARGTQSFSDDRRRIYAKQLAEKLAPFDDDVCGDVLSRTVRRLGGNVLQLMLLRKGMMPQWWQEAAAEKAEIAAKAAAAAAEAELDSLKQGAGKYKITRGELELAESKRSALSTALSLQLARYASSVCADVIGRVTRRLGDDTAALVLQSSSMAGACRHFARTVLEESRHHILNGGFHPRIWAQWASITHTSGNSLKVLRELTCNQRNGGESDDESDSDASAEEAVATEKSATAVLVPNVMHPKYGRKFRPVPSSWMLRKEFQQLRGNEGAQLASHGKKGATLSFTASIISSLRRAREAGTLINTTAADGVLGNNSKEFCVRGLVAGDGFKAGSSKEVRIGVALLTTTGFNQSPNDWSDFCLYSGNESWAAITSFLDPVLCEIVAINTTGLVYDNLYDETYRIKLSLGGDLPWLLAMLGKRNMNFIEGFSSYCLCKIPAMNNFFIADHTLFTADIAAMLTHTFPLEVYERGQHSNFQCPSPNCIWGEDKGREVTLKSKMDFKEKLAGLAECGKNAAVKTALKAFANAHYGFNFETPCPFKFEMVCPDPLHAYLNVVVAVSYHNALHPVSHVFALPCGTVVHASRD
eukprot:5470759-Pleurochrysis_carterae.AAC.2